MIWSKPAQLLSYSWTPALPNVPCTASLSTQNSKWYCSSGSGSCCRCCPCSCCSRSSILKRTNSDPVLHFSPAYVLQYFSIIGLLQLVLMSTWPMRILSRLHKIALAAVVLSPQTTSLLLGEFMSYDTARTHTAFHAFGDSHPQNLLPQKRIRCCRDWLTVEWVSQSINQSPTFPKILGLYRIFYSVRIIGWIVYSYSAE